MLKIYCTLLILSLCPVALPIRSENPRERSGIPRFQFHEDTRIDKWAMSNVKFSCRPATDGNGNGPIPPDITIKWYKNGKLLDKDFYAENERYVENKKEGSLTVYDLMNHDRGSIYCNVSNRAGHIIRNYSLEIINYCDLYATAEFKATHRIPLRCLCLWFIKFGCMKKGVDWSRVNDKSCRGYDSRPRGLIAPKGCDENFDFLKKSPKRAKHVVETPSASSTPPADFIGVNVKQHDNSHGFPFYTNVDETDEHAQEERIRRVQQDFFGKKSFNYKEDSEDSKVVRRIGVKNPYASEKHGERGNSEDRTSQNKGQGPSFTDNQGYEVPIVIPSGKTVKMSCKHNGTETEIIWRRGEEILNSKKRRDDEKFKISKNSLVMEIDDPVPSDSGHYYCEVWKGKDHITRHFPLTVRDRVRAKPFIVPNVLVNQTVVVGASAYFTCKATSDPVIHFVWAHVDNETELYMNTTDNTYHANYSYVYENNHTHMQPNGDRSELTIYNVTKADQGYYICIAGTSLGQSVEAAYLTVEDYEEGSLISTSVITICILTLVLLPLFIVWLTRFYCLQKSKNQIGQLEQYIGPERKKVVITKKVQTPGDDDSGALSAYHVQFFPLPSTNRRRQVNGGGRQPLYSDLTLHMTEYVMEPDPEWEIDRTRLTLIKQLGEGAFGEVWKASLKLPEGTDLSTSNGKGENEILVAVKRLKSNAQDKEMDDLIREMITFQNIGQHDNILSLIGCSTQNGPLYVVLELCKHGNLRDFLRAHRPRDNDQLHEPKENDGYLEARKASTQTSLSSKDEEIALINPLTLRHLVQFAWQVARGMQYMTSRKIIHRDLAARNVLVADDFVLKISDFGLSRDVHYNDYYRKKGNGRLPIKWMALEALDSHVYTVYSDVWSFGILLWEIITLGGTPYPSIAMQQLYSCLKEGYRMEAPDNCPEEIYNAMVACWQEDPKQRPTFDTLVDYFDWMLNQSASEQEKYLDLKSAEEEEDACEAESLPLLSESASALKKLRTRPLSEPIIRTPVPINDFDDESEDDENDTKSLLRGEKVVLCDRVDERKCSYAVLRRGKDTKLPNICTSKNADSKAASIDSAIGSPGWQMEAEASLMESPTESLKTNPEILVNVANEDETSPLLIPKKVVKKENFPRTNAEYYNCQNGPTFRETLSPVVCELYGTRQSCHSDSTPPSKASNTGASSLSSSPANDVFLSEHQPTTPRSSRMAEKTDTDIDIETQAEGRHRRFSDDSSSSGRGSGTSTEGFGIEQYCTIVENSSPSSKLFPFATSVFPDPFSSKSNSNDIKFFT